MAISRYHFTHCTALLEIVPGDCHGPKGPRNDTVVVAQVRNRYCANQQFTSPSENANFCNFVFTEWPEVCYDVKYE